MNWARRSDCNLCNTPKIGVQEERTGLGGGFNERGKVEYKQREVVIRLILFSFAVFGKAVGFYV